MKKLLTNNKGFIEYFILGIFLIALVGGGVWYFFRISEEVSNNVSPTQTTVNSSPTDFLTPTPDPYEGWKTYENEEYGYSIKYPPIMSEKQSSSLTTHYWLVLYGEFQNQNAGITDGLSITFDMYEKESNESLDSWVLARQERDQAGIPPLKTENLNINGKKVVHEVGQGTVGPYDSYRVQLTDTLILNIGGSYLGSSYDYEQIYKEIIDTLEFAN